MQMQPGGLAQFNAPAFMQAEEAQAVLQAQAQAQPKKGRGRPSKKQAQGSRQSSIPAMGMSAANRSEPRPETDAEGFKVPLPKNKNKSKDKKKLTFKDYGFEDKRQPSELVQKLRTEGNRPICLDNLPQKEREVKDMLFKVKKQMVFLESQFFKEEESEDEDLPKEELDIIV